MENTIALEYTFLECVFRNRRDFINDMKTNSKLITKKKLKMVSKTSRSRSNKGAAEAGLNDKRQKNPD
jgi:hypothetical protein